MTGPQSRHSAAQQVVATHDDAVERDGEMLALVGSEVVLLSAVATALVNQAATPISLAALTDRLVAQFGAPPDGDATSMVRELAEQLAARGVLEFR